MGWTATAWGKGASDQTATLVVTPIDLIGSGCGSLVELNERVRRRSGRIRLGSDSRSRAALKAEIRDLGTGEMEVILTVLKTAGEPFSRRIRAQNCDEALEALGLLIVLTLDPAAVPDERPPTGAAPAAAGGAPAGSVSRAPKRKVTVEDTAPSTHRGERGVAPPREPPEPAVTPDTPAPGPQEPINKGTPDSVQPRAEEPEADIEARPIPKPVPDRGGSAATRTMFAAGASGIGIMGPAPGVMAGASLSVVWGWNRDSRWSPAIVLAAGHLERNGLSFPGGSADFALDALQLELCPVWFGMGRRLGARTCALGMVAALLAKGVQTLAPEAHHRLFAVVGGSVAVIYQPVRRVEIVASAGVGYPLQRYSFQFDPAVFYRVAPVAVMGGLGVGLRFH